MPRILEFPTSPAGRVVWKAKHAVDRQADGAVGSHVRVTQTGEVKRITHHQHRHMKEKLAEYYHNIAQVDRGPAREEHHGHSQVQEVEEEGPHQVEAGELSPWPLLTTLMLEFPVRHLLSLCLL